MSPSAPPAPASPPCRLFRIDGGSTGPWQVVRKHACGGPALPPVSRAAVSADLSPQGRAQSWAGAWSLRDIISNVRHVELAEKAAPAARQEGLGCPASSCAAPISIRKSATGWAMTQDGRRELFEAQSRHIGIGMAYRPAIARRLGHCRDVGPDEPVDLITGFEYAPGDEAAVDDLLAALRASPAWAHIEREVDLRLAL